ncbi:hypothetical protein MJT46_016023 [Ovis ammon polii x Ovis aries]|nr:hypothetical protein MJT46_016023 [Ovis ammon polii x Ovis aries]
MAKWAAVVNQERQDEIGNLNLTYPLWQNNNNQSPPKPKQADLVMQCVSLQYFFFLILSNKQYFLSLEGSSFTIDSIGIISTSAVSDFESEARSFSLVIKVVDPGGLFTAGNLKVFLINVNNKDPILTCRSFNMENAILSVTSANSTLHNDVNITLDEEIPTGKTVARQPKSVEQWLLLLALMWRELRLHVVSPSPIKACEGDWQCAAILVTVCICGMNDNAPFFDQYLIRYAGQEMIAKDTVVAKLQCHDLDEPPDAIHYAPSLGPIGSGQLFEQAPTAGNFIQVVKELDYEDPDIDPAGHIYEMTISVFDDLHPSHTVTVTIIVETAPANDFSPVFKDVHYSFSIPETSGVDRPDAGREHCRFSFPLSMMTCLLPLVVVDILDKNDEAPVWTPSVYQAVIFDNVVAGTNVNGFQLNCHDRDSQDFEMSFEVVSGNVNNHFGFDPIGSSNILKLIVKNPFNFESGATLQQQYHLVGHITDDNLE